MGRSVSYPSGALVAYAETPRDGDWCATCGDCAEDCQCSEGDRDLREGDTDWDWVEDDLRDRAFRLFPSMYHTDAWIGSEDHVLATNSFVDFGVSEYCGVMAVWIAPCRDLEPGPEALAEAWVSKVRNRFLGEFAEMHKIGTFSNGECVYARATA